MALHDLPGDLLHMIMRQLSAEDLAALSAQNRYLRNEAGDEDLWTPLVNRRWPDCSTLDKYTSKRSLYSTRSKLPGSSALLIDKLVKLQQRMAENSAAKGCSHQIFEDTMMAVYRIGSLVDLAPPLFDIKKTKEYGRLTSVMLWWLEHKSKMAVAFVRETTELVQYGGGGARLQVSWRRSAIAFLADLLHGAPSSQTLHLSVLEALRATTAALNRSMQRVALPASPAPCGIPRSHWWWAASSGSCNSPVQVASPA